MELCSQNIKEISIVTSFVFQEYNDYWYKDLMRISEKWISYKRTNFITNQITNEWSYKTNSELYEENWDKLKKAVIGEFKSQHNFILKTDCGELNIRITLNNNEHFDMTMYGSLKDNGLAYLGFQIKKMIPWNEVVYPDFLDIIPVFFTKISLNRENIEELNKEDICALMYAEGGAMGNPGELCIIDIYGDEYVIDGIYADKCDITQIEVIEALFDDFKYISGLAELSFNTCQINKSNWIYINLGYGNHLYLRHDFWFEHGLKIMDIEFPKRYVNWKKLIHEY